MSLRTEFQVKAATVLLSAAVTVPCLQSAERVPVFIVAGQSNSDGRVPDTDVPYYADFSNCMYSYADGTTFRDGAFETYTPYTLVNGDSKRFGYDAFVYHYIGQATGGKFYVVKETLGGTAIDPSCANSNNGFFWSCDPVWYDAQTASSEGGKSLMKSFERSFKACVENTLGATEGGYEVKAILWHQGESDSTYDGPLNYYSNLSTLINHMRGFIAEATGNEAYRNIPFIMGTVPHRSRQYNADVEAAQRRIASEDRNVYLIDMSGQTLQKDMLHFDATSAEYMAVNVIRKLVDLDIIPEVTTWPDLEVTDDVLINPDFEINRAGEVNPAGNVDRGIPYGWESTGELKPNASGAMSYGINNDGANLHGDNLCWINSSPMPEFFELSQTIPAGKLVPGEYEVRCKLWVEVAKKNNCRMFANDCVQYFGYEADYGNLLVPGEDATYADYPGGQNGNFVLRNMRVRVKVNEGDDLKIGIRSSCLKNDGTKSKDNAGWFKLDEFRVFRIGSSSGSGIGEIHAVNSTWNTPGVYDMEGRLLRRDNHTTGLPSGIYVVNGKKTIVK